MIIRNEQIDVFNATAEESFIDNVVEYLRQHHKGAIKNIADDQLRRRVRGGVTKGRGHGFTWQSSLTGFVALMFELGPTFDQHAAFRDILQITYPDENERIQAIYRNVTDEEWKQAQDAYDACAWHQVER